MVHDALPDMMPGHLVPPGRQEEETPSTACNRSVFHPDVPGGVRLGIGSKPAPPPCFGQPQVYVQYLRGHCRPCDQQVHPLNPVRRRLAQEHGNPQARSPSAHRELRLRDIRVMTWRIQ